MIPYVYVVPLRNDLGGLSLQVLDLVPNRALRSTLDPVGQTFYVGPGMDPPGQTRTARGLYVGGSLTTSPLPALVGFDYRGRAKTDANGPSDVSYGMTAYLLDRVCVDPAGAARVLTSAEATLAVQSLMKAVAGRMPLDLKGVNQILSTIVGTSVEFGSGTYSFGTIEDLIRMLSGESFGLPAGVPITDPVTNKRLTQAQRKVIAESVSPVLAPLQAGRFLNLTEGGFRAGASAMMTEALLASNQEGHISHLKPPEMFVAKNPKFSYSGTQAVPTYPRAYQLDGNPVPPTGETNGAILIYTAEGQPL